MSSILNPAVAGYRLGTNDPYRSMVKLHLKPGTGSNFIDASPNGYTLTNSSGLVVQATPIIGSVNSFGVSSGTGRIVVGTSGANLNAGTADWAVEALVNMPLNHPDGQSLVFTRAYYANNIWVLGVNNDGSVGASANHAAVVVISALGVVTANTTTYLKWERSGNTATLYVNGVAVGSTSATGLNMNNTNTGNPGIGGYTHDTWGQNNGRISELRVTIGTTRPNPKPLTPFPAY